MAEIPPDLLYVGDHHWIAVTGPGTIRMGVTDFAQESLGDVVGIEIPAPGASATAGEAFGEVESTKSVNDLVAPVTGTVTGANESVTDHPELVNADPYGKGWLVQIEIDPATRAAQLDLLLSAGDYARLTGQQ